ncbi:MAG TPA: hypothetical protein VGK67_39140 [Myxococcales bacterium]|jgi:hypothetical protein
MLRHRIAVPLVGAALLVCSCGFQPVADVLASLSAQERAAVAAQTSSPTAGCAAQTLQDASCRPEADWRAAMELECARDGRTASRALFAGACDEGAFRVLAFECCAAELRTDPPQPSCESGLARMQGGYSSCKDKTLWTSYAEYECGEFGMFLSESSLRFVTECEPGRYETIYYDCCPLAPGTAWSLASDFGASRPDLFVSATGWVFSGDVCGAGHECTGYSWEFEAPHAVGEEVSCRFERYPRGASPSGAVLSEADCTAFKRWLTSDVFIAGLDDECGRLRGDEETTVYLQGGETHQKKYKDCVGEPFASHRAILTALVSKYFP